MIAVGFMVGAAATGCYMAVRNRRRDLYERKRGHTDADPPIPSPTPYPWMSQAVRVAMSSAIQYGLTDPDEIALYAAKWAYPLSPDGSPAVRNPHVRQGTRDRVLHQKLVARARCLISTATDRTLNPEQE
jgi:hypothetical protein